MITLIYDNTFEGLLSCIYDAFYIKNDTINNIYSNSHIFTPSFMDNIINCSTDMDKFKKVKSSIIKKINKLCLKKIYIVYLSNEKDKEILIFKYLKKAFSIGCNIHLFLNIDEVRNVDLINKRVNYEIHRFYGFVRFNYIDNNFLYSDISPDNDIIEFLASFFQKRFSNEYWIINDISRKKAVIYDKSKYEIVEFSNELSQRLSSYKDQYQDLWKVYFKATDIKERKNIKLQKQMMPIRYWKHIFETKD